MKRKACVETFSAMIDDSASSERASKKMRVMDASSSSSSSTNAYLEWISIAGRALWTMKHNEPRTTFQLLNAIRRLANTLVQNTQQTVDDDSTNNDNDNDALKNTLQKVESEIAPFFANDSHKTSRSPFLVLKFQEKNFELIFLQRLSNFNTS